MVHPLVYDPQGTLHLAEMRYRILREYSHSVRCDELGDAVIDLRIYMVRTSGEHYAAPFVFLYPSDSLFTLRGDLRSKGSLLVPGIKYGTDYLLRIYLGQSLDQSRIDILRAVEGYEGISEIYVVCLKILDIVFYILGIGSNYGTVEMIACLLKLISFIKQ